MPRRALITASTSAWPENWASPGCRSASSLGGADADALSFCLALEEISRVDISLGITLWVGVQGAPSMTHGSDEQVEAWREAYIVPTVGGEIVSAGAITEPDAGSDTAALKTSAATDGNEWVVNGSKKVLTLPIFRRLELLTCH